MTVAPLVGAWIEILDVDSAIAAEIVAPLVGAWIEMTNSQCVAVYVKSLPLWERGLKFAMVAQNISDTSRSPCGSVD